MFKFQQDIGVGVTEQVAAVADDVREWSVMGGGKPVSGQLGSGQPGSGQLVSRQLGSGQLGSGQLGSGQLGSGQQCGTRKSKIIKLNQTQSKHLDF